jgi:putative DNA methylase
MAMTKKLIEVALPLEAINRASARERSVRRGHPSKLHLWWSRKPLAICRAVLFASLIDDPDQPNVPHELLTEIDRLPLPQAIGLDWLSLSIGEQRRQKLFAFIERLIAWEQSSDALVLATAHQLIHAATSGEPPAVYDPFAGGGSIPLEAQRLGLRSFASDLNPVAVLLTKALIELPTPFVDMPPVSTASSDGIGVAWKGAAGLAADVRFYGQWIREEAARRIGSSYPTVQLPKEYGSGQAPVIAWLWARTVRCPNPACGAQMPLVNSFTLSTKKGHITWAEPLVDKTAKTVQFTMQHNGSPPNEGTVGRNGARCLVCGSTSPLQYVRNEGQADRLGAQLMAIVAAYQEGRVFLSPDKRTIIAHDLQPNWRPDIEMARNPRHMTPPLYGMTTFDRLYTPRQLLALTTFSDLIREVRSKIQYDAERLGDRESTAYMRAVVTYLAFALDKAVNAWSSLASWKSDDGVLRSTFARQALAMVWVYAEANPFAETSESIDSAVASICEALTSMVLQMQGSAEQRDATSMNVTAPYLFSTDPPYYDNIPYGDLSDYFYVWLRHTLGDLYPELMGTLLVPKASELVADPVRHGGTDQARQYFEAGMRKVFTSVRQSQHTAYPLTIFYAYKQSEQRSGATASTGWETMLESLIGAGLTITGTWPMRTERAGRLRETESNALASSIVLVCRPRSPDSSAATRREFLNALKAELPGALRRLQQGNIAPVDLAQAAIGPGIAIFSRYSTIIESDGSPMTMRMALQIINQELDAVLAEQEGEFDANTRWALAWFDQYGMNEGPYGVAETLSKAKNTSVQGMVEAGIIAARSGKVRLLKRGEVPEHWEEASTMQVTVWEVTQHLVWALEHGGERAAAILLAAAQEQSGSARDLAYRLYTTCERKRLAQEALAYNSLVVAWPEISRQAAQEQRDSAAAQSMDL